MRCWIRRPPMNTQGTIALTAKRLRWTFGQCAAALMLSACAGQPSITMKTLDGNPPLIIGHRGLPGLYPEEVIAGYRAAIAAGTDALELDLQSSSDGVLFACHNVFLSDTTDVAEHPEFASRKKSRLVDGVMTGPEWYISDFSAAELKTLRVKQPLAGRSKQYDGQYPMATFQEILDLAKSAMAVDSRHRVNVYPETKNALYQRQLGLPLEEMLLAMLANEGWNTADSPVFVQSFDPASLKLMRKLGLKTKVVQLIASTTRMVRSPMIHRIVQNHFRGCKRTIRELLLRW
jgi:glycerophosphoryl diester phosphodiesterase